MTYTSPIISSIVEGSVDVDFSQADPMRCGYIAPTFDEMDTARMYSRRYTGPIYPRSEWPDRIKQMDEANAWAYRRIVHTYQQKEGSCVYNSLALCMQITWNQMFGDHNCIPFSPMSGYRWNARGPGSGSTVGGSIKHGESVGLLPSRDYAPNLARVEAGDFAHTHGETGNWSARFQDGWKDTSRLFVCDEWEWCGSVEEWVSAQIASDVASGGRNSHCICHCGLAMDGGSILSIYAQSWGMPWGTTLETARGPMTNFGFDSESKIRTMVARDGWVLRTMRRPSFMVAA